MEKEQKTQTSDATARKQAQLDIVSDPDSQPSPAADDLDEGELARKDNSTEKAFDALEEKKSSSGK